jgi:small GTP-binding protein
LIAGNGGAGKTTLLRRYVDGVFDESTIETVGVDFYIKEIEYDDLETKCSLQLWDLGGQERFRHLLENFVMGARAALLLFDMTHMPLINEIMAWVNLVRMHDINLPIILVGTKSDLDEFIAVDDETALNIKQTFNIIDYIKTSSKSGTNVDVAFKSIIEFLITKSKF